jgi:hypothetical protein
MARQITAIDTSTDTFSTWVDRTNELIDFANTEVVSVNSTGTYVTGDGYVNGHFGANITSTGILRGGNNTTSNVLTIETNAYFTGVSLFVGNSTVNSTVNSLAITFSNSTLSSNVGLSGFIFGNVSVNTTTVSVGANVYINTSAQFVSNSTANVIINPSSVTLSNIVNHSSLSAITTGTSDQIVDTFSVSTYRAGQYTISVKDTSTSANAYQVSQLLITQALDVAYVTEYGIITSNTSLGSLGVFSANVNSGNVRLYFTPTVANTSVKGSKILITV